MRSKAAFTKLKSMLKLKDAVPAAKAALEYLLRLMSMATCRKLEEARTEVVTLFVTNMLLNFKIKYCTAAAKSQGNYYNETFPGVEANRTMNNVSR